MTTMRVLCPLLQKETRTILLSPSVGLVKLLVNDGQPVGSGQIIFELWRLNTCFLVELPPGMMGKAVRKLVNSSFFVAFHDEVIEIEPVVSSEQLERPKEILEKHGVPIVSPMDGMFYLSPSPTDPPFVKVGEQIMPGQTIGLIEVMKSFYPLKYQGQLPTILITVHVTSASPVTTGTKLFEVAA